MQSVLFVLYRDALHRTSFPLSAAMLSEFSETALTFVTIKAQIHEDDSSNKLLNQSKK